MKSANTSEQNIGYAPFTSTCTITVVSDFRFGDVNANGVVDIVDALLTAQYYVGLSLGGFNPAAADVEGNGSINIIDALKIAQYYVGLIDSF